MITHFDDKGKIFTEVVKKIPVLVTIQLPTQLIHGMIHIRSEKRLMEEMNEAEPFFAVTQVNVFNVDGSVLIMAADFMAVNKSQIVWITADNDRREEPNHD